MGSHQPILRRALALAVAAVLPAALLSIASASSAIADPANPTPVSGTALPTAQVNGVVWSQVVSNGVDFVGGSFSQSQPAGAADGVDVSAASNLFAFDVTSGAAVSFNATTNAQVRGVAASPDGSRIYIVGDFTVVNGQTRKHIAALDRSGNLISDFAPVVNGQAYSVVARGDAVYFGGAFTAVDNVSRPRAAAVTASGALLPFAPSVTDNVVRAVALSPDGSKVLLAGNFTQVNGATHLGMAAVGSSSGASLPWNATNVVTDSGKNSAIYSLSTRGTTVYATGYVFGEGGNLEGAVAMNWADGSITWIEDCHGDSYSSVPFNDALYVVSHAHNCANVVGGWSSPGDPTQWRRAQAFSQSATGTLLHNTDSYFDFGGQPSPTLVAGWSPTINTGTYTGSQQGAWSTAAGGSYLVLGGEFTKVNGQRQTGLVRFQGQPEAADTGTVAPPATTPVTSSGTVPNTVDKPKVAALGTSEVAVKWTAPKGASVSKITGYVVKAYKGSTVKSSVAVGPSKRLAIVGHLNKGTTYKFGVVAVNKAGSSKVSSLSSTKTKSKGKNVSPTKKPAKVKKPTASISKSQVRVRWSAASVSGALSVSDYQVRVVLHGKTVKTFTVRSSARSKLVSGLKRHTAYKVSVRAENWAGWGSWSTARSAHTK